MEHQVAQRSHRWFELRKTCAVTASRFGDAVGVGIGKPYDFLQSLIAGDGDNSDNMYIQHGNDMEPVILEAYELLTGNKTRPSGFWTPSDDSYCRSLKEHLQLEWDPNVRGSIRKGTLGRDGSWDAQPGTVGASPDAIVLEDGSAAPRGLCEFKAPVHRMYTDIPRQYMAQIQGQMAITGIHECDFMVMCVKTREVMLKRVQFHPDYWHYLRSRLLIFSKAFNETTRHDAYARSRHSHVDTVKKWTCDNQIFPGESAIVVKDLLTSGSCDKGMVTGPSGVTFTFDFLAGAA